MYLLYVESDSKIQIDIEAFTNVENCKNNNL